MTRLGIKSSTVIYENRFGIKKDNLIELRKYIDRFRQWLPDDNPETNIWYNKHQKWSDYDYTSIGDEFSFYGSALAYWSVCGEYNHLENILNYTSGIAHLVFKTDDSDMIGWIVKDGISSRVSSVVISLDKINWYHV